MEGSVILFRYRQADDTIVCVREDDADRLGVDSTIRGTGVGLKTFILKIVQLQISCYLLKAYPLGHSKIVLANLNGFGFFRHSPWNIGNIQIVLLRQNVYDTLFLSSIIPNKDK